MNDTRLLLAALAALLVIGCASEPPRTESAAGGDNYSQGGHAKYYEEIRAPAALGPRGVECTVR